MDNTWYYYNDENVTQQSPKKEDFKHAYILMYHRRGITHKSNFFKLLCRMMHIKLISKFNFIAEINKKSCFWGWGGGGGFHLFFQLF
jgi:CCR4-NOT transcriptional regulation complex NOT5 subunit